ncbi:MAG: GlsB/YeaQ/YmgE family stress response membrane protein [Acidimicrobiales bacterium]
MSILGWIVTGLLAGGLARMATGAKKRGCLGTMAVGILGAVIGGGLVTAFGEEGIDEFGLWSILVAFVGACLLLLALGVLTGGSGHRRSPARRR